MNKTIYKAAKISYMIPVALGIGAVTNIVLFFGAAFLFAGADGDEWVRSYFGGDDGYFMIGTIFIAICVLPFLRKLNIVVSKK